MTNLTKCIVKRGANFGSVGKFKDKANSEKKWDKDNKYGEVVTIKNFQKRFK